MSLNWTHRYFLPRSVTLQISEPGQIMAYNSVSCSPIGFPENILPVLRAFAVKNTPLNVFDKHKSDFGNSREEFEKTLILLLSHNLLLPTGAPSNLINTGFGSVLPHHRMLKDIPRVMSYRNVISSHVRDKTVLEIGCGSGILSLLAAKAGAKRVIAVEESKIAELAGQMFRANGYGNIDLHFGNSLDLELEEPVDVIVHELISGDPIGENVVRFIADARKRFLKPDGRLIPHRLDVCCVGIEEQATSPFDKAKLLREAGEFSRLYGLNFDPFLQALEQLGPEKLRRPVGLNGSKPPSFRILTEECPLCEIDFTATTAESMIRWGKTVLKAQETGSLGSLLIYFRAYLDEETQLSNSPFLPLTHWGWLIGSLSRSVAISEGDNVELQARIETLNGYDTLSVDLA